MNNRKMENGIWGAHGLKFADLHCDLWHWFEGCFFLKNFTFEDKFDIIEKGSLKENSAVLKAFCTSVLLHFFAEYFIVLTLIFIFIQDLKCNWAENLLIALHHLRSRFCISISHLYFLLHHIVNGCIFGWSRHPFIFWA